MMGPCDVFYLVEGCLYMDPPSPLYQLQLVIWTNYGQNCNFVCDIRIFWEEIVVYVYEFFFLKCLIKRKKKRALINVKIQCIVPELIEGTALSQNFRDQP